MKWSDLLDLLGPETVFESAMLLAGEDPPAQVRRQITRWTSAGRLTQLRRGLYAIGPPYAKSVPAPFAVASRLSRPSYVSLQSALAYHGVIPESVPVVTSVTTGRPETFETPLGAFTYRHVHRQLFWGYEEVQVEPGQRCFVATAEKALLDLFHLTPGKITPAFVQELRLEPSERFDPVRLEETARRAQRPKLIRAARLTRKVLEAESKGRLEV